MYVNLPDVGGVILVKDGALTCSSACRAWLVLVACVCFLFFSFFFY